MHHQRRRRCRWHDHHQMLTTKTEGMNTTFTPPKDKAFVEIEFSGCKTAALNGRKPVNGFVNGVQAAPTSQTFNSEQAN
jgi:hypothetical protein